MLTRVKAQYRSGVDGRTHTASFSIAELGEEEAMKQARAWLKRETASDRRRAPHPFFELVAQSYQDARVSRR